MFHHTKIVQQRPPKPHLRLHVIAPGTPMLVDDTVATRWAWKVEVLSPVPFRTAWWPTCRLALDAVRFQYPGEWP